MFKVILSLVVAALAISVSVAETAVQESNHESSRYRANLHKTMGAKAKAAKANAQSLRGKVSVMTTEETTNVPGAMPGMYGLLVWNRASPGECLGLDWAAVSEVDKVGACQEITDENNVVDYRYKVDCWMDNGMVRYTTFDAADTTCSAPPVTESWMDPVTCADGAIAYCKADSTFMQDWEGINLDVWFRSKQDAKANRMDAAESLVSRSPLNTFVDLEKAERVRANTDLLFSGAPVDTRDVKSVVNHAEAFDKANLLLISKSGLMLSVNNDPIITQQETQVGTRRFLVKNWYEDHFSA